MHWHHRPTIHSFSSCLQVFPWLSNYESVREWIHPPREERRTRQIWHFWQTYPTCASHGADFFSRKLLAVDFTSFPLQRSCRPHYDAIHHVAYNGNSYLSRRVTCFVSESESCPEPKDVYRGILHISAGTSIISSVQYPLSTSPS